MPCEQCRRDRQVIRGAMAKNVELLSYGNLSWITAVQGKGFTFNGVKMSDETPQMVYWKSASRWLGDLSEENRQTAAYKSRVRPMHRWRYAELEPEAMIKAFEKKVPAPPHVYWLQKLPKAMTIGIGREELCRLYMPNSRDCGSGASPEWSIWANSAGVVAQAHFDLEAVIFVQVGGLKKFTFWQPDDIGKLCMFPGAYPAEGQSQIDHDGGGTPARAPPSPPHAPCAASRYRAVLY